MSGRPLPSRGEPDLASYDHILMFFSGGKDSLCCLLHLLELGVDPARIELHHHQVDGRGGAFMDWPVTSSYVAAAAQAFALPLYRSWRDGGFERLMLRRAVPTAAVLFETPLGLAQAGAAGELSMRPAFSVASTDFSARWCSSSLKIDVGAAVIRNQDRFLDRRTLVVTGERAEESPDCGGCPTFGPHRTDTRAGARRRRHVDHWRPVHAWAAANIWETLRRHGVRPHPAYQLGWSRLSCMSCIFGSASQWATIRLIAPAIFERIATYEECFGRTMQRARSVRELACLGHPYQAALDHPELVALALGDTWPLPIFGSPKDWRMPAGGFGETAPPV